MLQKLIFTWQYFQNEQKITIYLEPDLFIFLDIFALSSKEFFKNTYTCKYFWHRGEKLGKSTVFWFAGQLENNNTQNQLVLDQPDLNSTWQ